VHLGLLASSTLDYAFSLLTVDDDTLASHSTQIIALTEISHEIFLKEFHEFSMSFCPYEISISYPWKTHGIIIPWNNHGEFIWAKTHGKPMDCTSNFP